MKRVVGILLLVGVALGQESKKDVLDVQEITSQLGICSANLVIEQRFTKALQSEIAELKKKLTTFEKVDKKVEEKK